MMHPQENYLESGGTPNGSIRASNYIGYATVTLKSTRKTSKAPIP